MQNTRFLSLVSSHRAAMEPPMLGVNLLPDDPLHRAISDARSSTARAFKGTSPVELAAALLRQEQTGWIVRVIAEGRDRFDRERAWAMEMCMKEAGAVVTNDATLMSALRACQESESLLLNVFANAPAVAALFLTAMRALEATGDAFIQALSRVPQGGERACEAWLKHGFTSDEKLMHHAPGSVPESAFGYVRTAYALTSPRDTIASDDTSHLFNAITNDVWEKLCSSPHGRRMAMFLRHTGASHKLRERAVLECLLAPEAHSLLVAQTRTMMISMLSVTPNASIQPNRRVPLLHMMYAMRRPLGPVVHTFITSIAAGERAEMRVALQDALSLLPHDRVQTALEQQNSRCFAYIHLVFDIALLFRELVAALGPQPRFPSNAVVQDDEAFVAMLRCIHAQQHSQETARFTSYLLFWHRYVDAAPNSPPECGTINRKLLLHDVDRFHASSGVFSGVSWSVA